MRRRGLGIVLSICLGGCGFRPVYGPQPAGSGNVELGAIDVPILAERQGQLLRQALVERLERAGGVAPKRYDLVVSYAVTNDGIAIQRDNSSSRNRLTARATWYLVTQDAQRRTVASGIARSVDGYNPIDIQFFSNELEVEGIQRRLAEQVADQMVLQLGLSLAPKVGG